MGAILTSGTLKNGQGFSYIRKMTGLQRVRRVREYVADSPFEYQKNCLLYLSKDLKKCRRGSQEEAEMIAGHIHLQNHLRILSAFYGILKPMDGVTPYRLEMQAKVGIGDAKNLYEYWGELLYRSVIDDSRIIINLASKEYSKCIEKYLTPQDRYITIVFCELSGDKLVTKGTYAKMARGEMVRFIAENNIENPVEIQKFDRLGYSFRSDLSSDSEYVFERKIK